MTLQKVLPHPHIPINNMNKGEIYQNHAIESDVQASPSQYYQDVLLMYA